MATDLVKLASYKLETCSCVRSRPASTKCRVHASAFGLGEQQADMVTDILNAYHAHYWLRLRMFEKEYALLATGET
jgi:hypothetical protein